MIAVIVIVGVLVGGALIYGGYKFGSAANPPTVAGPTSTDSADCRQACSAWDNARQMLCSAKDDEVAARSRADGIRGQLGAAIAAAVALGVGAAAAFGAAAAVAATASIFGLPAAAVLTGIGIALAVASALAWALAAFLTGELAAAEMDVAAKARVRQTWDAEVVRALGEVNKKCSLAEANACLSRSAPC